MRTSWRVNSTSASASIDVLTGVLFGVLIGVSIAAWIDASVAPDSGPVMNRDSKCAGSDELTRTARLGRLDSDGSTQVTQTLGS
jgi:hypothetical protein